VNLQDASAIGKRQPWPAHARGGSAGGACHNLDMGAL